MAVLGVSRLNADPWLEKIGGATKHAISLQQLDRWLWGATPNPNEAMRKAKLKMMLVKSTVT